MFNVGGGEIIVILLLALLLLGPEKLPDMARRVGKVLAEVRRMTSGFEEEMRSAMDIDLRDPLKSDALHRTEPGPSLVGPTTDVSSPPIGAAPPSGATNSPQPTGSSAAFVGDLGEPADPDQATS